MKTKNKKKSNLQCHSRSTSSSQQHVQVEAFIPNIRSLSPDLLSLRCGCWRKEIGGGVAIDSVGSRRRRRIRRSASSRRFAESNPVVATRGEASPRVVVTVGERVDAVVAAVVTIVSTSHGALRCDAARAAPVIVAVTVTIVVVVGCCV